MIHSEGFLKVVNDAKTRVQEISVEEVRARQAREEKFTLIDVREDREWDAGHAEGAIHLGRGIIERDIEHMMPDKGADLVLYCGGGYRSALAADMLQKMGYNRVKSMAGGIRAWRDRGCPEVK